MSKVRFKDFYWLLVVFLILFDQLTKIYIKTHFYLGEEHIVIQDWFRIHFVENPGVAFGMQFGGEIGKYSLSIFRILFSSLLFLYMRNQLKQEGSHLYYTSLAMILAGAVGNVIDGVFYGSIFSESPFHIPTPAHFVPFGEGYSSLFLGKVVDMLYFPLYDGLIPAWIPIFGGKPFTFFNFIFNIADSCITIGLLIFIIDLNRNSKK